MRLFLLACGVVLLAGLTLRSEDRKHELDLWLAKDRIAHALREKEVAKANCDHIRTVAFGERDPLKAIDVLGAQPEVARKELQAVGRGVSLVKRKDEKGVQPNARIAMVWWDTKANKARRSTAVKNNTFNPDTDRLLAAVAILDNKAMRTGKWVKRDDRPKLALPASWLTENNKKAFDISKYCERGPALGLALASEDALAVGSFTAEDTIWYVTRATVDNDIADWMKSKNQKKEYVNEGDRVAVMIVYQYAKPGDRAPIGYRFYAVSASGNLVAQFRAETNEKTRRQVTLEEAQFNNNR